MKIVIETIPHKQQRYPTVGDWEFDKDGNLHIKVSELRETYSHKAQAEQLIMIHELVEALSCKHDGVREADVTRFDKEFEARRHADDNSEPGDSPFAPYRKQHFLATNIERILAQAWNVNWQAYEMEINRMP